MAQGHYGNQEINKKILDLKNRWAKLKVIIDPMTTGNIPNITVHTPGSWCRKELR